MKREFAPAQKKISGFRMRFGKHVPAYSMLAIRIRAAEECKTGTFFFAKTDAIIAASFNVHPV
jgi:hypothetical protein